MTNSQYSKLVQLAMALARYAHDGQKYGEHDYFEYHVMGVAESVCGNENYCEDLHITALLHDVVEDTDLALNDIYSLFSHDVYMAISHITRDPENTYEDYIKIVGFNDMASKVKIADLKFNLSQPKSKNKKKYRKALAYLEGR